MAFNVRVFGYKGIRQIPRVNPAQNSEDAYYTLEEPYEWQFTAVTNDTSTPVSVPAQNPDKAAVVRIEVPAGSKIRYEINPPGRNVAASVNSPSLTGSDNFTWGAGWSISLLDAAQVAA